MATANIDPYLTVTSLGLLGYNTDEYKQLYPGIAMELPPVTMSTFDKDNEPSLLCCLHFLLSRLDYEEFSYATEDCWPYLCNKSKADYKNAVMASLRKLQTQRVVNVFQRISQQFWGYNFLVKGHEVWILLRMLSDACVDMAIKALSPSNTQFPELVDVPIIESPGLNSSFTSTEPGNDFPKKARRKSIVELQSEEFHSISHANSFVNGLSPDTTNMDRSNLLAYIAEMQRQVEELIVTNIAKENRQTAYMEELDARLKAARNLLDSAQKRIHKSMKQGGLFVLSDGGRKVRVAKLEKIAASLRLLEHLAESTLLGACTMLVVEDKPVLQQCALAHHDHYPLPTGFDPTSTVPGAAERSFSQKMTDGELQLLQATNGMNLSHAVSELLVVVDTIQSSCS